MSAIDDRKIELEPERMVYAINELEKRGFKVDDSRENEIQFEYKGSIIKFYPYTGWATGKTIKDGRGIKNLLKQL